MYRPYNNYGTDPYKLMSVMLGILLVVALIVLYYVSTEPPGQAAGYLPGSPATTSIAYASYGNMPATQPDNVSTGNLTGQGPSSNKAAAKNPSMGLAPGQCKAPELPNQGGNSTAANVTSSIVSYYYVTANATLETYIQMPINTYGSKPLVFSSQRFTSLQGLKVPNSGWPPLFFCNPSQQYDNITYSITAYT